MSGLPSVSARGIAVLGRQVRYTYLASNPTITESAADRKLGLTGLEWRFPSQLRNRAMDLSIAHNFCESNREAALSRTAILHAPVILCRD